MDATNLPNLPICVLVDISLELLYTYLKGVLHAEAVAADKPISVLLRTWLEERLDLATLA